MEPGVLEEILVKSGMYSSCKTAKDIAAAIRREGGGE